MTNPEMMKAEFKKGQHPKRNKLAIAGGALVVVVLVIGGVVGVKAANDYRAEVDAKLTAAQDYYAAAVKQNELTAQAASEAEQSAQDAQDAADAASAHEAAVKAAKKAAVADHLAKGLTADGKCPGGTVAGSVDADGIEGNCQPTNNGQPCVAYNDQNECTTWYKP
jgi:cytoskeletal protein RodZ